MNNSRLTTTINYFFVFLSINYPLITIFITKIDSAGYGLVFLSILVLMCNIKDFQIIQGKKPIMFWLLWCILAFMSYYVHPHTFSTMSIIKLYRRIFIPLIALTVVTIEYKKNSNGLLWLCFITHTIFLVAGYYFDKGILYRDLGEDNTLGNAYSVISSFSIFYLMLLNRAKKLSTFFFIVIASIVILVLAMSGTRKAFGAGVLLLVFWTMSQLKLKNIWSWILVAVIIAVGIVGYNYLMENTFMGQRMEALEKQQEQILPVNAPGFLHLLGDRAPHYYFGWLTFLSHPLFGVGTGQANVNGAVYIHSEYIAQLADNGIFGFVLFFSFYFWIIKNVLKKQKKDKTIGRCMLGGLVAMLFLFTTAWGWEFPHYFICLGVLVGYCQNGYCVQTVNHNHIR